ncbi:MAG: hypothetical protein J7K23_09960 [Thermoproteales archaeon]|nr:hypothetical protein [Thermoproteales archaeon]
MLTITGHRGAPDEAPENTLASFKKAIELGVDCIELDVRKTIDNKLVVIHDKTVDRTTNGTGLVETYTLERIKKLDAGSWFSDRYKGERIPTLEEALEVILDSDVFVEIELKDSGIEEMVGELLENIGAHKNIIISSFDSSVIKRFKESFQYFPTVLISNRYSDDLIMHTISSLANRIDLYYLHVSKDLVRKIHLSCLTINAWVIDKLDDLKNMINMDVDNITTNKPRLILEYMGKIMK